MIKNLRAEGFCQDPTQLPVLVMDMNLGSSHIIHSTMTGDQSGTIPEDELSRSRGILIARNHNHLHVIHEFLGKMKEMFSVLVRILDITGTLHTFPSILSVTLTVQGTVSNFTITVPRVPSSDSTTSPSIIGDSDNEGEVRRPTADPTRAPTENGDNLNGDRAMATNESGEGLPSASGEPAPPGPEATTGNSGNAVPVPEAEHADLPAAATAMDSNPVPTVPLEEENTPPIHNPPLPELPRQSQAARPATTHDASVVPPPAAPGDGSRTVRPPRSSSSLHSWTVVDWGPVNQDGQRRFLARFGHLG